MFKSSINKNLICFDLDGVYFPLTGKMGFHKRLVELTGTPEKVEHVLYQSPEMLLLVTGKLTPKQFVDWFNGYLQTDFTPESLGEFWVEDYEIDHEVAAFINKLRSKGYTSATVSNNNSIRINALQKRFSFLKDFDTVVFSYETGFFKPNKEIFNELIKKSGVAASKIIYADDNPDRLGGAQELGINTFVYENFSQFKNKLYDMGVAID